MKRSLTVSVALAILAAALPLRAQMPSASDGSDAAAAISAEDLRIRVEALAHDSMRGRDTPSPELEKAARYVATKFRTFGLRPAVGDGYLQRYPITLIRPGPASAQSLVLRGPAGERPLDPLTEFVAVPVADRAAGEGPLAAWSPGDREARLDGRVVLVRATPRELQEVFGRARDLFAAQGARGLILVVDAPAAYVDGLRAFFGRERASLGAPESFPRPLVIVPETVLPSPLAAALRTGRPLPSGWWARLRTEAQVAAAEGMNTIGWLEGSDPLLKDEYVVFTAHMDHVGVGRPVAGDSIYNGADDNASGTAAIVELAKAFAATEPRPRRSLVFITVSGEEKGLWGSRWYVENPLFPLARTVANVNIDMIGRNWKDTVVAIGKAESTLGPLVDRVASERPELGLAVIDDPWPEERFYYRSDHYNFARNGVPILFFFSGVHEDYHRPSDRPEKLDYEKMTRIARLIYHLGWEVANASEPPGWDEAAYRRVVEGAGR